jgi:hypothetical protein
MGSVFKDKSQLKFNTTKKVAFNEENLPESKSISLSKSQGESDLQKEQLQLKE